MRRTITQSLDNSLSNLSFEDKINLIKQVRELCFEHEMDGLLQASKHPEQTAIQVCKTCGSVSVSRYGYSNGKQRYRCNDCGHTFIAKTPRSLIDTSKLTKATWMRYINCFIDELPVAKCAEYCGISVATAYSMRLRILKLIKQTQDPWKLQKSQKAQLDETFIYESFKGNRSNCKNFTMPRRAFKRGRRGEKAHHSAGRSEADSLCVLTGVNEYGDAFLELASRSMMRSSQCKMILRDKISKGASITTDSLAAYVGVFNSMKVQHFSYLSTETEGKLNRVNALHSNFKYYLAKKRGVSTRRLPLYLAEYSWRWTTCMKKDSQTIQKNLIQRIARTDFKTTLYDLQNEPYPYYSWWKSDKGKREAQRIELNHLQHTIDQAFKEAGDDPAMLAVVKQRQLARDAEARKLLIDVDDSKVKRIDDKLPRKHASISVLQNN